MSDDADGAGQPERTARAGKRIRRSRVAQADASPVGRPDAPSKSSRGKPARPRKGAPRTTLPSREDILALISESDGKVGKREIARAFGIRGNDKIGLKALLKEMAEDGLLKGNRKRLREPGKLPPVTVLEIIARDDDGEFICAPATWEQEEAPLPRGLIAEDRGAGDGLAGLGDRVLAYIDRFDAADEAGLTFSARIIRKLPRDTRQLLGIFRSHSSRAGGTIEPVERKNMRSNSVAGDDTGGAEDGDLVRYELVGNRRLGPPRARVTHVLGNPDDQRQISLIAVHAHGIPEAFPQAALDELQRLPPLDVDARTDLRDVPLITIDPPDARDHDDAVWAAPDDNSDNGGGWIVVVAIADVAHYVRPGSALDRSALERANSVYFPDRVVPMLPEEISNDLCSLRENEERPCLAIRMWFNASGKKIRHRVMRGIMRSRAKLSYVEAQTAINGTPGPTAEPWLEPVLKPLWSAYAVLRAARENRSPLDLDLPERKIGIGDDGMVASITVPERLDAHRLIEEFMIQANVAAAEILETRRQPLVYRVHPAPEPERLEALRDFLETLEISIPKGGALKPHHFNRVLAQVDGTPHDQLVNEVILRAQSQAIYEPANEGHFGLNLGRYAHFTSPIRRYADLLVHRALISAFDLGDDGLPGEMVPQLSEIAKLISERERRAMAAERETVDRLIASHLAERIGATFQARVSGVTRSGLFVRLDETGADGFVPARALDDDYYEHDEVRRAMVGTRSGRGYQLGDTVEVELVEAAPAAGALRFDMLSPAHPLAGRAPGRGGSGRQSKRGKSGKRSSSGRSGGGHKGGAKRGRR